MSTGFWLNQDGLPLQFGVSKAVPTSAGDYLIYGETREMEAIIPLVPMAMGANAVQMPAPPVTFSGTSTPIAAGITSLSNIIPLQITPVTTVSGGVLTFTTNQLFFEQVEVDTIVGATGGTSVAIGLVAANPAATPAAYVQITPNAGTQIIKNLLIANITTSGQKTTWNLPGSTGIQSGAAANNTIAGGGDWLGTVPLVTNALTPLPAKAYMSTIATGAFTNGLIKVRLRYTLYGNISQ
jgi:hypothetical protein